MPTWMGLTKTTQAIIHECRSQLMRMISGLANVTGIVLSLGCVRLNETLSFGVA